MVRNRQRFGPTPACEVERLVRRPVRGSGGEHRSDTSRGSLRISPSQLDAPSRLIAIVNRVTRFPTQSQHRGFAGSRIDFC